MRKSKVLKNRATYTSSTESIKVTVNNLKEIMFGLQYLQNGATAPTLATILTHTNTVKIIVQGEVVSLIRFDDLWALNKFMGYYPFHLVPAGDNQYGCLFGVHVPVELTTDKDIYLELAYTGLATVDNEKLSLSAVYGDKPYSPNPLCMRYITGNTATSFSEFDMSVAGKKLVALLIWNTTIPVVGTSADMTVGELKLLVKREEKFHMQGDDMVTAPVDTEDVLALGVLDNYRYIDLAEDPVPADDLKVAVKSQSAATDAFRIIGVYR